MDRSEPEDFIEDPHERARMKAEADFGMREIAAEIERLPLGAQVLEIGCGTGCLLARLSATRPDLTFWGLEPIGKGFSKFETVLARITAAYANVRIQRVPIEQFQLAGDDPRFDFVFSVNVFEHLTDWRQAVDRAVAMLVPGGQMIVLCPNYSFPYEPHFKIPLLLPPAATRKLFSRRIETVERENDAAGLWESLNFISARALRHHCRARGVSVSFDRTILTRMLGRLDGDPEFARRQAGLSRVARLLSRARVGQLIESLPPDFSPYMKAIVRSDRPS
jgi:SAM-dependent methyltransferase